MKTNIEAIDFALLYNLQKNASSVEIKTAEDWDKRAWKFSEKIYEGFYNDKMEALINLDDCESILDVGCGPGTFAIKLAHKVANAHAFDFSSTMIEVLEHNAKKRNITNINASCLDINSNWDHLPVCDVVVASRCLEVSDIKSTLIKIDNHAKKRAYITYKVGKSFLSDEILKVIDREVVPKPDYIYILNILYSMGIYAKVDFIDPKNDGYNIDTEDDFVASLSWSGSGLNELEEAKARDYFKECKKQGIDPAHRNNAWAVIYWEKP